MADDEPDRSVRPRNPKRRRPNRERRGSSAEFVILADDGEEHVVQAVDPPYESNHIDTTESPSIRMTRGRAREDAATSQPDNQTPARTTPRNREVDLPGGQAIDIHYTWIGAFGTTVRSPVISTVEGHQPINTLERPVATSRETQALLEARITQLETENAALRHDNAALGVAITECNNVPRNDQDALLNLVRTTNIPRGVLLRLLDSEDFLEWWRLGSRQGGSGDGRSQSGHRSGSEGRRTEQDRGQPNGNQPGGSGQGGSRRGMSGRGLRGRGRSR